MPRRSAVAPATAVTVALLLRAAQLRLHYCRFAIAATPRRSATSAPAAAPRRSAAAASLSCCFPIPPHRFATAVPLLYTAALLRSAPLRVTLLHAASSAPRRLAAAALFRCCRAASLTATPQRVLLSDALEPIAVGLGAFQNMLGIMYCGCMFVATSLLSVYCPLLHRPVRLDSDIMGELKESRAYRHHDSHDSLRHHCHRRRQHRHSHPACSQ